MLEHDAIIKLVIQVHGRISARRLVVKRKLELNGWIVINRSKAIKNAIQLIVDNVVNVKNLVM